MKERVFETIQLPGCAICLWVTDGKCKHPKPVMQGKKCLGFDYSGNGGELVENANYVPGVYKSHGVWKQKSYMHV